jgi:hypothetical protein
VSDAQGASGPQFRADRPEEQAAVRTTIVGGRPPGSGQPIGPIPRGIEVLVKKASVDPEFRAALLAERAGAAGRIGLSLDPAEAAMLGAVPAAQLESIIARTTVPQEHRRAFLGHAAAAMLAAMGLTTAGCGPIPGPVTGSRPDDIPPAAGDRPDRPDAAPQTEPSPQPDETPKETPPPRDPDPVTRGIRPDRIPSTKGIRPD